MKSAASAIFQKAANWKTIIESVIYYGDLIRDTCHNQNGRGWGNYKELSWGGEPSHNALKRESWASPSSYIKVSRTTPGVLGQNCKKSTIYQTITEKSTLHLNDNTFGLIVIKYLDIALYFLGAYCSTFKRIKENVIIWPFVTKFDHF